MTEEMSEDEQKKEWSIYKLIQDGFTRELAIKVYEREKHWRDSLWQYMIDHHHMQPNGYYSFLIYSKGRQDFFRRLEARESDEFARYEVRKVSKRFKRARYVYSRLANITSIHEKAKNSGLLKRVIAILYEKYVQRVQDDHDAK